MDLSIIQIIHFLNESLNKEQFYLALTLGWMIWHDRNKFILKNVPLSPDKVMFKTANYFNSMNQNDMRNFVLFASKSSPSFWQNPNVGFFKLNVDVAIDIKNCRAAMAVIIRDKYGYFKAGHPQPI